MRVKLRSESCDTFRHRPWRRRGKINSILRLEGITDYITITIDDTLVCEKGEFKI